MRVSIVQCRGTPYEIGRQQGLLFAASRRGLTFQRSKVGLPSWFDMHAEERLYEKFVPAIFLKTPLEPTRQWIALSERYDRITHTIPPDRPAALSAGAHRRRVSYKLKR